MKTQPNLEIKHDTQHQLFSLLFENGEAHIKYKKPERNVIDIKETFVPKEYRHNGIATHLTEHVLKFARQENNQVIPSCPFVKDYVERNQEEYKDVLMN